MLARRPARPRLPEPPGLHGRAVRRRPLRRARRPDVPHRRPAPATARTAPSSTSAGSTTRSRSAASASSSARSRRRSPSTPAVDAAAADRPRRDGSSRYLTPDAVDVAAGARVPARDAARRDGPRPLVAPGRAAADRPAARSTARPCPRPTSRRSATARSTWRRATTSRSTVARAVADAARGGPRSASTTGSSQIGGDSIRAVRVVGALRERGVRRLGAGPVRAPDGGRAGRDHPPRRPRATRGRRSTRSSWSAPRTGTACRPASWTPTRCPWCRRGCLRDARRRGSDRVPERVLLPDPTTTPRSTWPRCGSPWRSSSRGTRSCAPRST